MRREEGQEKFTVEIVLEFLQCKITQTRCYINVKSLFTQKANNVTLLHSVPLQLNSNFSLSSWGTQPCQLSFYKRRIDECLMWRGLSFVKNNKDDACWTTAVVWYSYRHDCSCKHANQRIYAGIEVTKKIINQQ